MFNRIALILLIIVFSTSVLKSQNSELQTVIELQQGNYTQKEIIKIITKQKGILFSYSDNILYKNEIPIAHSLALPLNQLMDSIFVPLGYNYELIGAQIVLYSSSDKMQWVTVSGFLLESKTNEVLIGATLFCRKLNIGIVTNAYGFYSLKLPKGQHTIEINCLGYKPISKEIFLWNSTIQPIWMEPASYQVQEINVDGKLSDQFLESSLTSLSKLNIKTLQNMPSFLGEKDAIRNIAMLPGVQSNEMSTGNIYVRGGSNDQTIFLMDEAPIYNASHFGGFFSVFNPDVVNSVSFFKSNIPAYEGGTLSSLIDVRLRDGNDQTWKTKGSIGIISARASVEGPLIKDKSSVLLAVRRSFADRIYNTILNNNNAPKLKFYFYDANLKANYKINDKNRIYLSGYTGYDNYSQYDRIFSNTNIASFRWNHLFSQKLFCNTTLIYGQNKMNQSMSGSKYDLFWQSNNTHAHIKTDFTHYQSEKAKANFGFSTQFYHIIPNTYISEFEGIVSEDYITHKDQQIVNSAYYSQKIKLLQHFNIDAGLRLSQMISTPFDENETPYINWYTEPHVYLTYSLTEQAHIKGCINHQVQPMHQLPLSTMGISINRLLPASENFRAQTSTNYSLGFFSDLSKHITNSIEGYYRNMNNMVETLQDMVILSLNDPNDFLYHAKGEAYGIEFLSSIRMDKFTGIISADLSNVIWLTNELNNNMPYPASHARKNSFLLSANYQLKKRWIFSASWQWASGLPFTAATGKYEVDGKTYLKFDRDKINTQQMPAYHRLDLSVDLIGKNNDRKKWKSFWNLSIYNAYFKKNPLGVYYFAPIQDKEGNVINASLSPSYFYLYQFVPSISYRFEF